MGQCKCWTSRCSAFSHAHIATRADACSWCQVGLAMLVGSLSASGSLLGADSAGESMQTKTLHLTVAENLGMKPILVRS